MIWSPPRAIAVRSAKRCRSAPPWHERIGSTVALPTA
jgi:hypothetical protein